MIWRHIVPEHIAVLTPCAESSRKAKKFFEGEEDGGSDEAAIETVKVPEEVPVTRKRGRPRKSPNVESSSTIVRRSTRKKEEKNFFVLKHFLEPIYKINKKN